MEGVFHAVECGHLHPREDLPAVVLLAWSAETRALAARRVRENTKPQAVAICYYQDFQQPADLVWTGNDQ